ncbi:MAG: Crp/Fnr family transcriptional regulator [Gammaproteobacteria bacterium]
MRNVLEDVLGSSQFPEGVAWTRRRYKSGDKIVEKGDVGASLFVVNNGIVRVLGEAEIEGNIRVAPGLCDLEAGAIFGDICLFGEHRRTATVVALTDVGIIEIRSDMLSTYLDNHPVQGYSFLKALFGIMAKRLELANERIDKLLAWGIKAHEIDKYL